MPGLGAFLSQNAHPDSELVLRHVRVRLGYGLRGNVGHKHCWPLNSCSIEDTLRTSVNYKTGCFHVLCRASEYARTHLTAIMAVSGIVVMEHLVDPC